jgi:hypothetical protein
MTTTSTTSTPETAASVSGVVREPCGPTPGNGDPSFRPKRVDENPHTVDVGDLFAVVVIADHQHLEDTLADA